MADTIYQGDIGTEILVDCGRDIAGADNPALMVRTPSGVVVVWPATTKTVNGETRYLSHVTRPGDLAEAGAYRIQASLSLGGWSGLGKTAQFTVRAAFA